MSRGATKGSLDHVCTVCGLTQRVIPGTLCVDCSGRLIMPRRMKIKSFRMPESTFIMLDELRGDRSQARYLMSLIEDAHKNRSQI